MFHSKGLKCYGTLPTALYSKIPLSVFLRRQQRGSLLLWTISLSQLGYQIIMHTCTHIYHLLWPIYSHRSQVMLRTLYDKTHERYNFFLQAVSFSCHLLSPVPCPNPILHIWRKGERREKWWYQTEQLFAPLKLQFISSHKEAPSR